MSSTEEADPRRHRVGAAALVEIMPQRGEYSAQVALALPLGDYCARLIGQECTAEALAKLLADDLKQALGAAARMAVVDVRVPDMGGCDHGR